MTIRSYRDLAVWQKSVTLIVDSYKLTRRFPRTEQYALSSQLQRAAASVAANIAEGAGRRNLGEYIHFLGIARGSLMELETHVIVAQRLAFLTSTEADSVLRSAGEVGRMLAGLIRSLEALRKRRAQEALVPDPRPPAPAP